MTFSYLLRNSQNIPRTQERDSGDAVFTPVWSRPPGGSKPEIGREEGTI
jgi:hypothetical protein